MSRHHTIEETIKDTLNRGLLIAFLKEKGLIPKERDACSIQVTRGLLIAFLKEKGLIPKEWDACSIQVTRSSAGDEIEFVSKRSYVALKSQG